MVIFTFCQRHLCLESLSKMLIIDGVVKNQKKSKQRKVVKSFFCHHKSVTLVDSVTEVQNWTTQSTPPRMENFSFLPE